MRSVYQVALNTPEELRVELLGWLERQMAAVATFAAGSRLARDRRHYESQRAAYSDALEFWREIRIEPRNPSQYPTPTALGTPGKDYIPGTSRIPNHPVRDRDFDVPQQEKE